MMLIEEKTLADHDINVKSIRQELSLLEKQLKKHGKNDLPPTPSAQPEPHWISCSERLPDEDHWLGGSGRQFSEKVMVTIVNHSDEDAWVDATYTIDGKWALELPRHCKIIAWMPLPEAYHGGKNENR